jgi:hypothetical protein
MTPSRGGIHARTPADSRLHAAVPVHGHRSVRDRHRILLCDADLQRLHAQRVILHRGGFEVDATRTAAEALDRITGRHCARTSRTCDERSNPPAASASFTPTTGSATAWPTCILRTEDLGGRRA